MIMQLKHGVTIHSQAAPALVQSVSVEKKFEEDKVLGMGANGKTQVKRVFDHTHQTDFEVEGKGDLTLDPGVGVNANITLISGGLTVIPSVSYRQALSGSSSWNYKGTNYPEAAAA